MVYLSKRSRQSYCRQIQKIRQNVFYSCFFRNLALGWLTWYSLSNPSISRIFLEIPNTMVFCVVGSQVVRELVRQLVPSLSGDNNLVPFPSWRTETVLNQEKFYNSFVQHCLQFFFFKLLIF